jgi:hypothetical protein
MKKIRLKYYSKSLFKGPKVAILTLKTPRRLWPWKYPQKAVYITKKSHAECRLEMYSLADFSRRGGRRRKLTNERRENYDESTSKNFRNKKQNCLGSNNKIWDLHLFTKVLKTSVSVQYFFDLQRFGEKVFISWDFPFRITVRAFEPISPASAIALLLPQHSYNVSYFIQKFHTFLNQYLCTSPLCKNIYNMNLYIVF